MHSAGSQRGGNGSRNGDKKRPADKPEISDSSKAKRKLWERSDEDDRDFQEAEEARNSENVKEMTKKYNFDFLRDEPLPPGRYIWEKASSADEFRASQSNSESDCAPTCSIETATDPNGEEKTVDKDTKCQKTSTNVEREKDSPETIEESETSVHFIEETEDKTPQD